MQDDALDKIEVTVIICTRNRADHLRNVLNSALNLAVPAGLAWELLIIDNGSTDNTAEVAASLAGSLPIRCVREDRAGLSNARNRGVTEARGAYICWTDDDVLMDRHWLAAYVEAFRAHPEAAVFGGHVIPVLEKPSPDWVAAAKDRWPLNIVFAARDFGDEEVPLSFEKGCIPFGANFALRTAEQRDNPYDPNLGVSPTHRRTGEECDVIHRIMAAGGTGWWVPGSKVNHIIPSGRQTFRHFYEHSYLNGETTGYLRQHRPGENYLTASGSPPANYDASRARLYLLAAFKAMQLGLAMLSGNVEKRLNRLFFLGLYRGMLRFRAEERP